MDALEDAVLALAEQVGTDGKFPDKLQQVLETIKRKRTSQVTEYVQEALIGKGRAAKVHLVRKRRDAHDGRRYAMKVTPKTVALGEKWHYQTEREVLTAMSGTPGFPALHAAMQDDETFFMVLDFCAGGDMLTLLDADAGERPGSPSVDGIFAEKAAKFYIAEVASLVHALHAAGYAHGDVKPDNFLIDAAGHVVLADFGSSSPLGDVGEQRTAELTADYAAPEQLSATNDKHCKSKADWWAVGVALYEMVVGALPFTQDGPVSATHNCILDFEHTLEIPAGLSASASSLIKQLLCKAEARLTFAELMEHPFFEGIQWRELRTTTPPWIPALKSQSDTAFFAPDMFETDDVLQACRPFTMAPARQLECVGFSAFGPPDETEDGGGAGAACFSSSSSSSRNSQELERALNVNSDLTAENRILRLKLKKVEGTVADMKATRKTLNQSLHKERKEALNQSFEYHRRLIRGGSSAGGNSSTPVANRSILATMMSPRMGGSPLVMTPSRTPFKRQMLESSPFFALAGSPARQMLAAAAATARPRTATSTPTKTMAGGSGAASPAATRNTEAMDALETRMRGTNEKLMELECLYATEREHSNKLEQMLTEVKGDSGKDKEEISSLLALHQSNSTKLEAKFEEASGIMMLQAQRIEELESHTLQLEVAQDVIGGGGGGGDSMIISSPELQAELHKLASLNCELEEQLIISELDRLQLHLDVEYAQMEQQDAEVAVGRADFEAKKMEQLARNLPKHFEQQRQAQLKVHSDQVEGLLKRQFQLETESLQQIKLIDVLRVQIPDPTSKSGKRAAKKAAKARSKTAKAAAQAAGSMAENQIRAPLKQLKASNPPADAAKQTNTTPQKKGANVPLAPHRLQGVRVHPSGKGGLCSLCNLTIKQGKRGTRNGICAMRCMLCDCVFHQSCHSKLPAQCTVAMPFTPGRVQDDTAAPSTLEVLAATEPVSALSAKLNGSSQQSSFARQMPSLDMFQLDVDGGSRSEGEGEYGESIPEETTISNAHMHDCWLQATIGPSDTAPLDVLLSVARGKLEVFQSSNGVAYEPATHTFNPKMNSVVVKDIDDDVASWIQQGDRARGFQVAVQSQCWPEHTIYFLAPSAASKRRWVSGIKGLGIQQNASTASYTVASLDAQNTIGCLNAVHNFKGASAKAPLAILATDRGLFIMRGPKILEVVAASSDEGSAHHHGEKGSGPVSIHEMHCIAGSTDTFLIVVGAERSLNRCTFKGLSTGARPAYTLSNLGEDCNLEGICQVTTGTVDNELYIVAVSTTTIYIYKQERHGEAAERGTFARVHAASTNKALPGGRLATNGIGVLAFLSAEGDSRVVWGDRTFYAMNPSSKSAAVLPSTDDFSLRFCGIGDASMFAMAIFELGDELLLCYNQGGLFMKRDGSRSREGQLLWTSTPTGFAMVGSCLYVCSFESVELIDLSADMEAASRRVLPIPGVRLLGGNGAFVLLSSSHDGQTSIKTLAFTSPDQDGQAKTSTATTAQSAGGAASAAAPMFQTEFLTVADSSLGFSAAVTLSSPFKTLASATAC